jgi:hypothetical protein
MQERHLQDHFCAVGFVGHSLMGPVVNFGFHTHDGKFWRPGTAVHAIYSFGKDRDLFLLLPFDFTF